MTFNIENLEKINKLTYRKEETVPVVQVDPEEAGQDHEDAQKQNI